jgi:hypothetical protein
MEGKPNRKCWCLLFNPILCIDLEVIRIFSEWKGNQTENVGKVILILFYVLIFEMVECLADGTGNLIGEYYLTLFYALILKMVKCLADGRGIKQKMWVK